MKWWHKALLAEFILLLGVGCFAWRVEQQIQATVGDPATMEKHEDRLGEVSGELVGAGSVFIWGLAWWKRNKAA